MPSKKLAAAVTFLVVLSMLALVFYAGASAGLVGVCPVTRPQVCVEIYAPVYGVPTFRMHSNSCMACMEGAWFWIKTTV